MCFQLVLNKNNTLRHLNGERLPLPAAFGGNFGAKQMGFDHQTPTLKAHALLFCAGVQLISIETDYSFRRC